MIDTVGAGIPQAFRICSKAVLLLNGLVYKWNRKMKCPDHLKLDQNGSHFESYVFSNCLFQYIDYCNKTVHEHLNLPRL